MRWHFYQEIRNRSLQRHNFHCIKSIAYVSKRSCEPNSKWTESISGEMHTRCDREPKERRLKQVHRLLSAVWFMRWHRQTAIPTRTFQIVSLHLSFLLSILFLHSFCESFLTFVLNLSFNRRNETDRNRPAPRISSRFDFDMALSVFEMFGMSQLSHLKFVSISMNDSSDKVCRMQSDRESGGKMMRFFCFFFSLCVTLRTKCRDSIVGMHDNRRNGWKR